MTTTETYRPRHLAAAAYVVLCPDRVVRHPETFATLAAADDHGDWCCHGTHRVVPASAWPQPPTTAIARVPAG